MDKKIILVVDDTPENIAVLNGILSPTYKVKGATSGRAGLAIAEKEPPPDLILLDVMMPEMDGYEVCRQLKNNSKTRRIPVLFVTAKVTPEDKQKSLSAGGLGHLTKPVDADNLLETVELAIETGW